MSKAAKRTDAQIVSDPGDYGDRFVEFIRSIAAVTECDTEATPLTLTSGTGERVVFDIDCDGDRYILLKMPRIERKPLPLSPREREIVRMVAQGYQNKIIAAVLNISSWTVCTHLRRIFAKLGVSSRAAMVARLAEYSGVPHPKGADDVGAADGTRSLPNPSNSEPEERSDCHAPCQSRLEPKSQADGRDDGRRRLAV
jgi:DNA-binding CsgD family transcriptional regulator